MNFTTLPLPQRGSPRARLKPCGDCLLCFGERVLMKAIKQNSAVESTPAFDTAHTIKAVDPELWRAIEHENRRQHDHIELIASENYVSPPSCRRRDRN